MESLTNIRFNHEAEFFFEALGVTESDADEITRRVADIREQTTSISTSVEMVVKEFSGGHLAYALLRLGALMAERNSPAGMLSRMLSGEACDCPDCRARRGE